MILKSFLNVRNKYLYQMSTWREAASEIKTFVFLDLESTGLPLYENNKTRITELCLTAIQAEHIRLGVFPRVQNKLNLCFNPCKLISADAEKITAFREIEEQQNNKNAEKRRSSSVVAGGEDAVDATRSKVPVEFTASYDRLLVTACETIADDKPLFSAESQIKNETTPQKQIITNRSLLGIPQESTVGQTIKILDFSVESKTKNETTPQEQIVTSSNLPPNPKKPKIVEPRKKLDYGISYKLGDVFSRLTKKAPINSHQADGDVQMLIMCAATLGDSFVDWCNQNAKKFCDIPAMVPGKKIGT
ncbi:uncharacterized protein LOC126889932 isoform X2 [Diabrotica virgifera virgifera]|uniref:Exonuclease domain-containing protein n=1 Tax=Diabrotica virgifera virgifera TaxID=50390 RepID=A0ABM5KWR7_DIAVI|nr:uncharacterized protein LOC126889932 isoform X2 [Diabrotica virgifera virgifera]